MYHALVRAKLRSTWDKINAGYYEAAVKQAQPRLKFRFIGDTAWG
jgi:hypothetical protein